MEGGAHGECGGSRIGVPDGMGLDGRAGDTMYSVVVEMTGLGRWLIRCSKLGKGRGSYLKGLGLDEGMKTASSNAYVQWKVLAVRSECSYRMPRKLRVVSIRRRP